MGLVSPLTMRQADFEAAGIACTEVTERIFVIHGNNRSRTPFSHSFLVLDTVNVLFDAGCGLDVIERLLGLVRIDRLFLSHSHVDHTAGCRLMNEKTDCEIVVPETSSDTIANAELLARRFVGDDLVPLWMETYPVLTGFRDFSFHSTYDHAYELRTGHLTFLAVPTPGHLEDHTCFFEPDRRILIGFDIDLSPFGPWYGNPESDIDAFRAFISRIRELKPEIYLPSHAKPVRSAHFEKRLARYEASFDERDRLILAMLTETPGMDLGAIVRRSPFYDADHSTITDELLWFGEEQMVQKHLDRLLLAGVIRCDRGRYLVSP
ncbi:MAG TPA: MBL fold metallo-hydrolase [Deltaproteobacteria bacterium]|nr:MBL fold metallo-hydrolase [Deltaproteobacteria bacterium]